MKSVNRNRRITRRDFLLVTGVAAASLAAGCGRRGGPSGGLTTPSGSSGGNDVLYASAKPPAPPSGDPDLVLRNGKVITVDINDTIAQALAVKDGRIQAVGSNETIDALKGGSTQVVDLNGRAMTPGLIDPHFHLGIIAAMLKYIPFMPPEVENIPELQKKLKEVVAQTPAGNWILGYFFLLEEGRAATAQELDTVSPNHPVWIIHQGGHFGSANTMALQLADITKDTPNPMGSIIERDKDGNPTGAFYNHRAMDALRKVVPAELTAPDPQGLTANQDVMLGVGITTFHDVYVRGADLLKIYADFGSSGAMKLHGAVYPIIEYPTQVESLLKLDRTREPWLRVGGMKLQIDGQGPTAFTNLPHDGPSWDMPAWDVDIFKQTVRTLHEAGVQISTHCLGDAALDLTLDAYEEAMNASPRSDPRHRIEHVTLSTTEAHKRMKDLGVIASVSSSFIPHAGDYFLREFKKHLDLFVTTRSLLDQGVAVCLNSDYPTTTWAAPVMSMAGAVNRQTQTKRVAVPEQAITIAEALRAHTMGGAYSGFDESDRGSLEPGKLADLAVWTNDPLSMTPEQIGNATIDATYVEGKVVYGA
ncbi:MAG: amidohydrolase [Anaerolineales bacterium]|nr:amidohydrolase [Anaerolineales bacterium]